jgi:hypothetical protein
MSKCSHCGDLGTVLSDHGYGNVVDDECPYCSSAASVFPDLPVQLPDYGENEIQIQGYRKYRETPQQDRYTAFSSIIRLSGSWKRTSSYLELEFQRGWLLAQRHAQEAKLRN